MLRLTSRLDLAVSGYNWRLCPLEHIGGERHWEAHVVESPIILSSALMLYTARHIRSRLCSETAAPPNTFTAS